MRQIAFDTETTGIGAEIGHRVIEIGCIELIDRKLTGQHFHTYLNPERDVDAGAFKVHGISSGFLQDKPRFADIVDDFLHFIEGAQLIIHNAPFDIGFINAELKRLQWSKKIDEYCSVLDTLVLARERHPGQRNNLDALCKRYHVENSNRKLHGALLDAEILAFVYLNMTGGQANLFGEDELSETKVVLQKGGSYPLLESQSPVYFVDPTELAAHEEFVKYLINKSGKDYWSEK